MCIRDRLNTDTVANPGTGDVAREYWDGDSWEAFTAMATNADAPYGSRADNIGTVTGSEQVRFGNCDDQVKTTVNGVEKYYIRFRITSAITSGPVIEQVKLHTNRFEVNADGFTEYFGDGVYSQDLVMHWHLTEQLVGFSPINENITFASGLTLAYSDNEFVSSATDGRGGYVVIPEGMDTSKDLEFEVLWTPLSNNSGDVVYQIDTYQTSVGDTLDSGNTAVSAQDTVTVASNSDNLLTKTVISLDVQNLVPGDILAIGFKRLGGDAGDTYPDNVAIVNIRCVGKFWKP